MDETRIPWMAFDLHKKCEFHVLQLVAALAVFQHRVNGRRNYRIGADTQCRDNASCLSGDQGAYN